MRHNELAFVVVLLILSLSGAANADSVSIADTAHGKATTSGASCGDPCLLPLGVTVLEQSYVDGAKNGEVYDFDVVSLPPGTEGYTLTLTGSAPLLNSSDYGSFVCADLSKKTKTQCGLDPIDVTTTANSVTTIVKSGKKTKTKTSTDSVTFSVNGDSNLVFYAIFVPKAVVTADLSFHSVDIPAPQDAIFAPQGIVASPEPRFVSLLLAVGIILGLGFLRRRQRTLAEARS